MQALLEVFKDIVLRVSTALEVDDLFVETTGFGPGILKFVGIGRCRADVDAYCIAEPDEIGACQGVRFVGRSIEEEWCLFVRMFMVSVCHGEVSMSEEIERYVGEVEETG